jgi:hypothetical protein
MDKIKKKKRINYMIKRKKIKNKKIKKNKRIMLNNQRKVNQN